MVDWQDAHETVGGDRQLLCELIEEFTEESDKMLNEIGRAISGNDSAELRRSAHAMKGALGHLGANQTSKLASKLEAIGESGVVQNCDDCFKKLTDETKQLTGELASFTKEFRNQL